MLTREKLFDFIQKQNVTMLASIDEDGFPNAKAMFAPRKIEGDSFYFTTNLASLRTQQFLENPKSCIYFYKKGRFKYEGVMLAGLMEVLQDDETRHEIWRPGDEMFYRQGETDPDYCVLKFTAIRGRRYCDLKSKSFIVEELA